MKRFLTGIHDKISDAITGDTTIRAYDKKTGQLVETYKMLNNNNNKQSTTSDNNQETQDNE